MRAFLGGDSLLFTRVLSYLGPCLEAVYSGDFHL